MCLVPCGPALKRWLFHALTSVSLWVEQAPMCRSPLFLLLVVLLLAAALFLCWIVGVLVFVCVVVLACCRVGLTG